MKMIKWGASALALGLVHFAAPAEAAGGKTLETVKARGMLNCTGHDGSYLGFAEVDDKGNWKGMDIDLCKAVAAAVFGDPAKLKVVPISWAQRWPALQSGDVDIIVKASGGTLSRDTELGLQFSMSYYLGTTKVMAHKELNLKSLKDAAGGTICIPAGTSQEQQVAAYTAKLGIKLEPVLIEKTEELEQAYFSGRCDLYAQWGPTLAIARIAKSKVDDHVILPDVLAVEPEVMIMRQGDDNWVDIANWTLSTLIFAEQEGITSKNVDEIKAKPTSPQVAKFLGVTPGMGKGLGLSDDWAYKVIKNVGNYGEIFDRDLGKDSPYKMDRELTNLWNNGGVLFPLVVD
ncbi:amino acid ABC transporter substrate-binding protein [Mesorhizobium sp. M7A.T.Ca.TU.009.01.3.2]|jgi:general L-amino acid transport system substrate-binding protein|uniref:amino acid ABC transporter substrate-binding protein n=3 Tax=Mesorhizobium TaxID=68287 RepID=UPI000FC9E2F4|nr:MULTISPECIES: amino acid ABC transporter substrate-binding protein [unclassified Mesorhizobium]RUU15826.1 amino acid ABC transporter substrate-binding protein [Mesorhizobium sp. M7A.T.Ca.TU.009.01.3.2]RUU83068.1 amino acid ABC transporter substrate-binding protein [Mesorhizobium sp. M7A.T.Ca.TU.009.01.3.1]RWD10528.1 MAG: amino acid ABC transporter substrate-binding protein [Mesorhizobium sp.]AZV20179.1 amino acid ABC transporter substrate-binding protein [Mesorhizobium sp. M7A.F.Ce.TU.012.03